MSISSSDKISLEKTKTSCLIILAAVALIVALIYTKYVLVPLTIAIFLSSILCALVEKMARFFKTPPLVNVIAGIVLSILLFTVCAFLIYYTFFIMTGQAELHKENFIKMYKNFILSLESLNINVDIILWEVENLPFMKYARSLTGSIFSVLGNFVLVVAFSLFLITGSLYKKTKTPKLFSEINDQISQYASVKFLMSLFTGFLVGLILFLFGSDAALVLGFVTVILNFIPAIGSIVASFIPVPFLLLQFGADDYMKIILVTFCIGFTQLLIGNLLEPKFYGESLDLHPVVVLVCLIFWGLVWGIPGMFLAVPITGALKITLNRIPATKPIAQAFSGRFS